MSNIIIRNLRYENEDALENMFAYGAGIEIDELSSGLVSNYWQPYGVLYNDLQSAINSFKVVKRIYEKIDGNLLHHVIVNIKPRGKLHEPHATAIKVGNEIGCSLYNEGFQNVFFIHHRNGYVHLHIVINSINYKTGNRIVSTQWLANIIRNTTFQKFKYLDWETNVIYNSERYIH